MEKGRDVLIVYDDLTQHARAYREISCSCAVRPGREAFPGDNFLYSFANARAGPTHLNSRSAAAGLSPPCRSSKPRRRIFPPTSRPILFPSRTDRFYLSPTLFNSEFFRRWMSANPFRVWAERRSVLRIAQLPDISSSITRNSRNWKHSPSSVRASMNPTRKIIDHGQHIRACLKQAESRPVSMVDQDHPCYLL